MALFKTLSRLLSSPAKPSPALHLAAFGKHPGWNDHLDDLGLDTDALVTVKRLLYMQGISQNIDSGAWDHLEPAADGGDPKVASRLEDFRHDFLWSMPPADAAETTPIFAGRLWSSTDGKGRAKYPMVLCAQLTELSARFAAETVLPELSNVHEQCAAAAKAEDVSRIVSAGREQLRGRIGAGAAASGLPARQLVKMADHPDMLAGRAGFHRIVYQFVQRGSGMSAYRVAAAKAPGGRRPEQLRLPACGMSAPEALLFWHRFALSFLDASTPLLLFAPDQGALAPWVDLIAGEPAPGNIFCIKAGPKTLPYASDIPYTLDGTFTRAIDSHLSMCATGPDGAAAPPWPTF